MGSLCLRKADDFIGADTARKFLQMGRTRSLRYALRPGGKKYEANAETGEKQEMKRTGKVYDQGKLTGAGVFEEVLKRCWQDAWYADKFERWKGGERGTSGAVRSSVVKREEGTSSGDVAVRRIRSRGFDADAEELVAVKVEEQ
jgi:hypothetical protein